MDTQNLTPQPQNVPPIRFIPPPKKKNVLLISVSGLFAGVSGLVTGLSINFFPDNAPIEFLENFLATAILFGLAFTLGIWSVIENSNRKRFIDHAARTFEATGDATVNEFIVKPKHDLMNKIFIGVNTLFIAITFVGPILLSVLSRNDGY